ncbi:MAG TPA: HAD-IIA family hydrolase [Clostridiaceae bacterium]|nr:HAD-IIA family hydrolase [Clostridiaceae bacterium]
MNVYLIDLDGTLYRGNEPIEHAAEFIDYLNKNNRKYLLTTNCPLNNPDGIVARLKAMGITTTADNVLTSSMACRDYLLKHHSGKRVFVIGSPSFLEILQTSGIHLTNHLSEREYSEVVVIGYDQQMTYSQLKRACINILNGAEFITTNMDNVIPHGQTFIPHTGSITAAVQYAVNKEPVIIGKPFRHMFDSAVKMLGCNREDCVVIGDRLDTDILFAKNNNIPGYLVFTGVTTHSDLEKSSIKPDKCFNTLKDIIQMETGDIGDISV